MGFLVSTNSNSEVHLNFTIDQKTKNIRVSSQGLRLFMKMIFLTTHGTKLEKFNFEPGVISKHNTLVDFNGNPS